VETLRPRKVCFCHHDPLIPGQPGTGVTEAAALIERERVVGGLIQEYAWVA
jgi:hypothetical protein